MLKIETNIKPIEIEVNGHQFTIAKTDTTLKQIDEVAELMKKKSEEAEKLNSLEGLAKLREASKKAYATMLGEGSFDKIENSLSDVKGEFTYQMVNHFFKIYNYITEETFNEMEMTRYDKGNA